MNIKENPYVSDIAKTIEGSKTRYYTELAAKYEDTVSFAVGEPDFTTPQHIIEVAAQKLIEGETHYAPNPGILPLRKAIAEKYNALYPKQDLTAENVVVTNGAQEANLLAMMMFFNPGDEVVVPAPSYISYSPQFQILHIQPNYVPTDESAGYTVEAAALEAAITPKTKAVLLNSPCNPTGTVLSGETLRRIVDIAKKHRLGIIADETYAEIVYEPFTGILDIMEVDDSLIYCSGFSKTYGMTGWRIGYTIAAKEVALAIRHLHENTTSCTNTALQLGAVEALLHGKEAAEGMRLAYEHRRNLICSLLSEIEAFSFSKPQGAFYVFVNIKKLGLSAAAFTEQLLEKYHVIVAPGTIFGEAGEGYIRLSYATSEENIREGMRRIAAFVKSLQNRPYAGSRRCF